MISSPETMTFIADDHEIGERLDKVIAGRAAPLSRVKVQQLIKEGFVTINSKIVKAAYRLETGDMVAVQMIVDIVAPDLSTATVPEALPLDVLYEDDDLAAINKPAGMVIHPAAGHASGTLVNALLARWPQVARVGGEGRAGIVHRLDKDTSGVILIAKTEPVRLNLMAQFEARTVEKRYLALVEGLPATPTGDINAPIARDPDQRKQMAIVRGGRPALTRYQVLQVFDGFSLLEALPRTGRTHQIRVHLAFIAHPIVGDTIYGHRKQRIKLERHFLHAESLSVTSPSRAERLTFHAPLPADLQDILDQLAQNRL